MSEKTTLDKVRWMVTYLNITQVSDLLGMSRHTLYKRLAMDEWKNTEVISIDHYYELYRNAL